MSERAEIDFDFPKEGVREKRMPWQWCRVVKKDGTDASWTEGRIEGRRLRMTFATENLLWKTGKRFNLRVFQVKVFQLWKISSSHFRLYYWLVVVIMRNSLFIVFALLAVVVVLSVMAKLFTLPLAQLSEFILVFLIFPHQAIISLTG